MGRICASQGDRAGRPGGGKMKTVSNWLPIAKRRQSQQKGTIGEDCRVSGRLTTTVTKCGCRRPKKGSVCAISCGCSILSAGKGLPYK
jgi:hypothetical protein